MRGNVNQRRGAAAHIARACVATLMALSVTSHDAARASTSAIISVTTLTDENGAGVGCSLREAVRSASDNAAFGGCAAGSGADTLVFDGALANGTINLTGGLELAINGDNLTIDASAAPGLTISRTDAGRLIFSGQALGQSLTLIGFTLSGGNVNGTADDGGAVYSGNAKVVFTNMRVFNSNAGRNGGAVFAGSTFDATNSTFSGNSAGNEGGAIFAGLNSFGLNLIADSTFSNNQAVQRGGALFVKGSADSNEKRITRITNSTFTGNKVTSTLGARGGAINVNSTIHISNSLIERNDSNTFCGGVNLHNTDNLSNPANVPAYITSTRFISNSGQLFGGLCVDGPVTVTDSLFERNYSNDEGGGLFARDQVTVRGSTFLSNTSRSSGAGLSARLRTLVSHSRFIGNFSQDGLGGGVHITSTASGSLIANSLFVNNQAAGGAAIGVRTYTNTQPFGVTVNHVTMVGNFRGGSGGVEVTQYGVVTVTNSIIGRSDVSLQRRPEWVPTARIFEDYNLLYAPVDTNRHQGLSIGANTIAYGRGIDPGGIFVGADDFHLAAGSIALDKADPTIVPALGDNIDFDNESRPNGTFSDIGYDERSGASGPSSVSIISNSPTRLGNVTNISATAVGGANIVYAWNFGDGSPVFASGATPNAARTYANTGTYTVIVTASNSLGSVSANTTVTITNAAPIANAGPDAGVLNGATVTLNGAASADPDGHTPISYQWTQTGGAAVTLSSASAVSPTFVAPQASATLTFSLVVVDARGLASAPDTVVVTVSSNPINGLTATNNSPTKLGTATQFSASVASSAQPVAYQWHFGVAGATASGANPSYTYPAVGTYIATVTATNGSDTKVTTTQVVVSQNPITGLVFPSTGTAAISTPVVFAASITGGGPVTYEWQVSGPQNASGVGASFAFTFTTPGTYLVTVIARNAASGESRSFARTIVVSTVAPPTPSYKTLLPLSVRAAE